MSHPSSQSQTNSIPNKRKAAPKRKVLAKFELGLQSPLKIRNGEEEDSELAFNTLDDGDQMILVRKFAAEGNFYELERLLEVLAFDYFDYPSDTEPSIWQEELTEVVMTAINRRIVTIDDLVSSSGQGAQFYGLDAVSINDYSQDELATLVRSFTSKMWIEREDLTRIMCRGLGFSRLGSNIRERFKKAITGAIRRGWLEYQGTQVRRL